MFNLKNLYLIFLVNFFLSKSIDEKMLDKNFLKFEIDSDGNKWKLDEEGFINFNFYKKDYEKFINSEYFYMKNENNNINILRDWNFKSGLVFNDSIYDWFSFLEENEKDLLEKGCDNFIDISWKKSKNGYIENKFFIKNFAKDEYINIKNKSKYFYQRKVLENWRDKWKKAGYRDQWDEDSENNINPETYKDPGSNKLFFNFDNIKNFFNI